MLVASIQIDSTKVAGDLTDFPVYVDLSDLPSEFWNTVANGGGDIRVFKSDGTTELAREVVFCDTSTDTGELHFKFTGTLSGSVDTVVQIHADGTSSDYAPTDTYGRNNVWVSGYKLVHHMQNTSATDSTSNGLSGTLVSMDSSNVVTGKLSGKGYDFDGTADYVTRGTDDAVLDFGSTAFNISFWLNSDINSPHILSKKLADVDGGYEIFDVAGTTSFRIRQSGANKDYNKASLIASTDGWTLYHFVGSPATGGDIYKNGSLVALSADAGTYTSIQNTANPFMYGRAEARGYYNGKMDELRVYSGALLSTDWITTEYNNQNSPSTFYSVLPFFVQDNLSLVETILVNKVKITTITETLALTETFTSLRNFVVNILETVTANEKWNVSKWINQNKTLDTWSGESKPTTTFTKQNKSSSTWTEQNK